MTTKNCVTCNKSFSVTPSLDRVTHCSRSCAKIGHTPWNKGKKLTYKVASAFKKGHKTWNKGKPMSEESKEKLSQSKLGKMTGEDHWAWKDEGVGYRALHRWVENHLGKPTQCEQCKGQFFDRRIQWANKSHEYKRDLTDWIRLCAKCHYAYDRKRATI